MKIYVFDDKDVNIDQAHVAIEEAGHEIPPYYGEDRPGENCNHQWKVLQSLTLRKWEFKYSQQVFKWREKMFAMVEHAVEEAKANGGGWNHH
jgi:hypothetical protein